MFIGFTLFGLAVLRARVLPRWFGYLLFVHIPSLALLLLAIYKTLIPEIGQTSRVPVIPSLVAPLVLAFLWLALGYVLWSTAPPNVEIVSETIGLRARRLKKWTGFSEKTLWDWMQLSITASIPVLLAVGGLLFNAAQNERNKATEEWRAQDAALQNYYDVMSDLLTNKGLRNSELDAEVRTLAGARTATVLARFQADVGERDPEREKVYGPTSAALTAGSAARKANILTFLYNSDLITKNHPVVKLSGADLTNIDLPSRSNLAKADLSGAKLQHADLSYSNLSAADLSGADLSYANLLGADLNGADLSKADLHNASIVNTDLRDTTGLTPAQIDLSIGNETTRLPSDLQVPESWLRWDAREQEEIYGVSKSRGGR